MKKHINNSQRRQSATPRRFAGVVSVRRGFTLVEMMVAVALTLLIMSMFAQLYGTIVSTITLHRGVAENDQRARALNSVILEDLNGRTYRQSSTALGWSKGIVPLMYGDGLGSNGGFDKDRQQGYFYYSENDPYDDTDDVLQFTTRIGRDISSTDGINDGMDFYFGKAFSMAFTNIPYPIISQPSRDPGSQNAVGQSRAAEVSYFLRNGNLYRRVLLLRDSEAEEGQPYYNHPTYGIVRALGAIDPGEPPQSNTLITATMNYYGALDYSATRAYQYDTATTSFLSYPWFATLKLSLDNSSVEATNVALALPWNRYGHFNSPDLRMQEPDRNPPYENLIQRGLPREFKGQNGSGEYIGRLTLSESTRIGYPGNADASALETTVNQSDLWDLDAPTGFANLTEENRIAEDLLMSNVESFNVEMLYYSVDQAGLRYANLGDELRFNNVGNDNNRWRSKNSWYGPGAHLGNNNVFDTWHPNAFTRVNIWDQNNNFTNDERQAAQLVWNRSVLGQDPLLNGAMPPRRPLRYLLHPDPVSHANYESGAFLWQPDFNYADFIGVHVIPPAGNGSIVYRLINSIPEDKASPTDPDVARSASLAEGVNWNSTPGEVTTDNGCLFWQCLDNRIGVQGLRITIRFRDPGQDLPRQLTLIHSFVE